MNASASLDGPPAGAAPAWRFGLAAVVVALMPLSFNLGPYLLADKKPLYVSPLDILLPILILVLLADLAKGRLRDWAPPAANLAWAVLALASLAWTSYSTRTEWARSALFQTTLVVLFAVWAFRLVVTDARTGRRLALVLGASCSLCLLYALYQYVQPQGQPLPPGETDRYFGGGVTDVRVAGWYPYRAVLAAQIAMLVPAAAAFAALDSDPVVRVGACAFAVVGLCVCLSGGGVLAAGAGVLAVAVALWVFRREDAPGRASLWGPRRTAALVVAGLLLVAVVLLPRLPRRNPAVLGRTLSPWVEVEEDGRKQQVPSARLRRFQAAWNLLVRKDRWPTGVGAGGYQSATNQFYAPEYPKPGANIFDEKEFDTNGNEPLSFGLLETTAVELGLPGVVLMLCAFLTWIAAAAAAFVRLDPREADARALALAALGAGVGALVYSVFGSPLVRGPGGSFAFWMGLALALNAWSRTRRTEGART
jgi:hypothetical protein